MAFMQKIKNLKDVVDWGLCVGCGACQYHCDHETVSMVNYESVGIRPKFDNNKCNDCTECLEFCPGYRLDTRHLSSSNSSDIQFNPLLGSTYEIWEGNAIDHELRYKASSGGILSALALYCLEQEHMDFILHTGMDPSNPLLNKTVVSKTKADLLKRAGSRYAPSSPCDSLHIIEKSNTPCVFIGKPCDVAALSSLRKIRPKLDKNLGLVLTFFCAGTPSTQGTIDLLEQLHVRPDDIDTLTYRGSGWPGLFKVSSKTHTSGKSLTYEKSWSFLEKYRTFRCKLCPDSLGEFADIASGDAWHIYKKDKRNPGMSLILVRSKRGKDILHKATKAGYIEIKESDSSAIFVAQGLPERRKELFGRILAMRLLLIPTPEFKGFSLLSVWKKNSLYMKWKTIAGTIKRLLLRGLWHRNQLTPGTMSNIIKK